MKMFFSPIVVKLKTKLHPTAKIQIHSKNSFYTFITI